MYILLCICIFFFIPYCKILQQKVDVREKVRKMEQRGGSQGGREKGGDRGKEGGGRKKRSMHGGGILPSP